MNEAKSPHKPCLLLNSEIDTGFTVLFFILAVLPLGGCREMTVSYICPLTVRQLTYGMAVSVTDVERKSYVYLCDSKCIFRKANVIIWSMSKNERSNKSKSFVRKILYISQYKVGKSFH